MPFEVGPFPEKVPYFAGVDEPHFGDRFLDVFTGAMEGGTDEEEFDTGAIEPLPFPNLLAQVQWRTAVRPELLFEGGDMLGDFGLCESHNEKQDEIQREMRCKGGKDSGGTSSTMLRACPGTRRMKPRRSSVRTMECLIPAKEPEAVDAGFELDVCRAMGTSKKAPACCYKQIVDFDSSGGFFHGLGVPSQGRHAVYMLSN